MLVCTRWSDQLPVGLRGSALASSHARASARNAASDGESSTRNIARTLDTSPGGKRAMTQDRDTYGFANDPEIERREQTRLETLARWRDPRTQRILDAIGVEAGWTCL